MKIVATIEARMTSRRLPGKVLLPAANKPMLEHLIDRLRAVPSIDEIILATTVNVTDEPLVQLARRLCIPSFRGDEDNVLNRVISAAEQTSADIVVEITADCPIIDPDIVEQTIRMFQSNSADYVSNAHVRSYPDGMDTQVLKLDTLKQSAAMTSDSRDLEHVTLYIRNHPEIFSHIHLVAPSKLHWPDLGLTLDEAPDYALLKLLIEHFHDSNPLFSCYDVIKKLNERPDWVDLNKSVPRDTSSA